MAIANRKKIFDITEIALMAAIICISSWITVPLGTIPFTLQTFGVFLAFRFLGGKKGLASVAIYILLGAVGLPVFSNFGSGIGKILGPTGGYLLGFAVSGFIITVLEKFDREKVIFRIITDILSLVSCYALGTVWFYYSVGHGTQMSVLAMLSACVFPFVIPDIAKILLAELISSKLQKALKRNM